MTVDCGAVSGNITLAAPLSTARQNSVLLPQKGVNTMSWLLLILALALLGGGIGLRVWKRGTKNRAHVLRITGHLLLVMSVVVGIYAIPPVNNGVDWFYFVLAATVVVGSFVTSFLARNPVKPKGASTSGDPDEEPHFQVKSKSELEKLSPVGQEAYDKKYAAYKKALKDYHKKHRFIRWSKVPALVSLVATIVAFVMLFVRWWFHLNLADTFDPTYHPTAWWEWVAVMGAMVIAVVMRFPLRLKRMWVLAVPPVIAVLLVLLAFMPAFDTFKNEADKITQTTEELAADDPQPVELLTTIDQSCSVDYTIPSEKNDAGELVPNQTAIEEIAGPPVVVTGHDPESLLQEIREVIDNEDFIEDLKAMVREGSDTELTDQEFKTAFDALVADLESASASDMVVQYGNVLCLTPEAQGAHHALYGVNW
jgi:hypothetical protein